MENQQITPQEEFISDGKTETINCEKCQKDKPYDKYLWTFKKSDIYMEEGQEYVTVIYDYYCQQCREIAYIQCEDPDSMWNELMSHITPNNCWDSDYWST